MGKFTGKPDQFDGKNHGFRLRFSPTKPIHWIIHSKSQRVQAGLQFFMEEERLGHGDRPETWI